MATYFLGNSQLITTVAEAYCSPELLAQVQRDWAEQRMTRGELTLPGGRDACIVSCNMALLGEVWEVEGTLHHMPGMQEFLNLVEPDATTIVVMLRGHEFTYESLVDADPHWDFIYEGRPADSSRLFLQTTDVLTHLDTSLDSLVAALSLIRERFPEAAVHYAPPPPPLEAGSRFLEPEGFGPFAELAQTHGVRPFALRRKIYDAMYDRLGPRLSRVNVEMLPAPPESVGSSGALLDDYAADFMHANVAYARALVRELEKRERDASLQQPA